VGKAARVDCWDNAHAVTRMHHDTTGMGRSERRDAAQRYALPVTHSWRCHRVSHRRVIPAHHWDGDMDAAVSTPVEGWWEGARSVSCDVRPHPSLSSPCTHTEQQWRGQKRGVSVSHGDESCNRTAVGACCVAIGMQQRHVGVGCDRSTAALPLPLRYSDGGARSESHRDTLRISQACEWLHSNAAMCLHECERDGKRHDWQKQKTENRVPAFKGYIRVLIGSRSERKGWTQSGEGRQEGKKE